MPPAGRPLRPGTGGFSLGLLFLLSCTPAAQSHAAEPDDRPEATSSEVPAGPAKADLWSGVPSRLQERGRWAFEFGVGIIGDTTPGGYLDLEFDRFNGSGEGLTYNLTIAYQIHQMEWRVGHLRLRPVLEVPFMLTLVDQSDAATIPDINLGIVARWRDFPWNRWVYTTFAAGPGLSYAFENWRADIVRHPGEDRSQLKFWLNIELTLALPALPQHQLTAFIDHQSGGHIFDSGGIDAWGFGYRFLF